MIWKWRLVLLGCVVAGLVPVASCVDPAPAAGRKNAMDVMADDTMTLVGLAENAKAGAHLSTDGGGYYVQGLTAWPDSLLGRRVVVTGVLQTVEHRPEDLRNARGEYVQGMTGTQRMLRAATWRLAE